MKRKINCLSKLIGVASALSLALAMLTLPCAPGSAAATRTVTTSLGAPLDGAFFVNNGDQPEWVDLTGSAHLVVQAPTDFSIPNPPPIRVHVNMAGVEGVGRTTGRRYELTGAEDFEFDGALPASPFFQGGYRLTPTPPPIRESPDPPPIIPSPPPILPVDFSLTIEGSGIATQAAASVGSVGTTDH